VVDKIKVYIKETGFSDVDWICLSQKMLQL